MGKYDQLMRAGPIKGLLLDITGVLYNSGADGGTAIEGSIEAIRRLQDSNLKIRFCSNETHDPRRLLVSRLQGLGFTLTVDQILTPAPVTAHICQQRKLRPFLLTYPGYFHLSRLSVNSGSKNFEYWKFDVKEEFAGVDQTNPNCVVVGDAAEEFSYANVNRAFNILMESEQKVLLTMGMGKYYMETDGLKIDLGAYTKALEFATESGAEVIGKPSPMYFQTALDDLGLTKDEVIMVGDDIVSDVGGAQKCGLRGVSVRTGKWRPEWENHPTVKPDAIVDNLAEIVNFVLEKQ